MKCSKSTVWTKSNKNKQMSETKIDASKYKTEMCKEWQMTSFCKYGNKCKFAHGKEELNKKFCNSKFKSKLCKSYYNQGFCRYGSRCQFIHDERILDHILNTSFY